MPAYNFQSRFAPLVESGKKRQTIRPERKRPTRQGDTLYLYTGMRTKACRLLREAVCKDIRPIIIVGHGYIILQDHVLSEDETARIARNDGFISASELIHFFKDTYGLPFEGELIEW